MIEAVWFKDQRKSDPITLFTLLTLSKTKGCNGQIQFVSLLLLISPSCYHNCVHNAVYLVYIIY